MKRIIYKIIVFTLMFCLLVPTLSGCAKEDEKTLIATAEALIEKSKVVNEICFGKGLSCMSEGGYILSGYVEASKEDCERYGISSTEDIKALAREVYSVAACDYIDQVIFAPVQTGSGFISYRRYFDATEDDVAHLMVKKEYEPLAVGEVSYTNVRVASQKRNRAEILVDITVTEGDKTRTDKDVALTMRKENDAWRLDTLTYASIE